MRSPLIRIGVVFVLLAGAAAPAQAALDLEIRGGGIGQTLTFVIAGPAGAQYLNILSFSNGPTCFPPPNICIDVGIEFLTLSISIPGFLGVIPPAGQITLNYPVPNDPIFNTLPPVIFQAVLISSDHIADKSNVCKLTFANPATFEATLGAMAASRALVKATKLNDGRVLVSGGGSGSITGGSGLSSCEIYNGCLETFSATGSMGVARASHSETKLNDGRVLVTGGLDGLGVPLATAEIFNPATGTWSPTAGAMARKRVGHTAALLPDGRVLIAGGSADTTDAFAFISSATATTEIYNPANNTFAAGPNMSEPKVAHSATVLADGKVLVAAGFSFVLVFGIPVPSISNAAQVFNPASGTFGSNISMKAGRLAHSATLLADGRVLLAGGAGGGNPLDPQALNSAELFNGASFAFTGSLAVARALHTGTILPSGKVLAAGGAAGSITAPASLNSAEVFDPASGTWATVGSMTTSRSVQAAILLDDLTVLVVGGAGGPGETSLSSAEVFQP